LTSQGMLNEVAAVAVRSANCPIGSIGRARRRLVASSCCDLPSLSECQVIARAQQRSQTTPVELFQCAAECVPKRVVGGREPTATFQQPFAISCCYPQPQAIARLVSIHNDKCPSINSKRRIAEGEHLVNVRQCPSRRAQAPKRGDGRGSQLARALSHGGQSTDRDF
jgi:hypothetical protein